MSKAKEFTVHMDDRPGTLGNFCQALADREVNILALQSFEGVVRLVVDNAPVAQAVMDTRGVAYTEAEVAQIQLSLHRPGDLARVALRLGAAGINIDYAYVGAEPGMSALLVFFGVADVDRAAAILDEVTATAT
jgi:hypothetical protein